MKQGRWRKHHKWFGIAVSVFLMMFVLSGIILNHREQFASYALSRKYLPARYEFENWNGGLMRGTAKIGGDSVVIYGTDGAWLFDTSTTQVHDFNQGLPAAVDSLNIRRIISLPNGQLIAAATTGVYSRRAGEEWQKVLSTDEKITDIEARGDSVIVLSRSNIYLDAGDGQFRKLQLKPSKESDGKVSLFRTVWCLHSGELFGLGGRIFMDVIGLILLFLCFSGIFIWLCKPGGVKRWNVKWHGKVGTISIIVTLLIVITGWCLRPPVMVPLALTKTSPLPGSSLDADNPWEDKLRAIRYDDDFGDWLISTSEGFFSLKSLADTPHKLTGTPPVSVMGINAWEKDADGSWLCGSFSGMYRWDRKGGFSADYFSHERVNDTPGPPFGKNAIAGFSDDFGEKHVIVDYYDGTDLLPQPEELSCLPMSLWNLALEVHSGRLFIGAIATYVFVFVIGAVAFWCLLSGYRIRPRSHHKH